jgi:CheY-like chemotaxis protein
MQTEHMLLATYIRLRLTDIDGYQLAQRIRALPQTAYATLIALTK